MKAEDYFQGREFLVESPRLQTADRRLSRATRLRYEEKVMTGFQKPSTELG